MPVPAYLTEATPLPDVPQRPLTCADLADIAAQRADALARANADKAAIRALAGKVKQ